MFSKVLFPVFLFVSFSVPSVYFMTSPLSESEIDHSFYDNERLFTRFGDSKAIYKTSIEDDSIKIRDYLLNGSFNLYWRNTSDTSKDKSSNAFLLNILYPDYVDKDDPEKISYSPRYFSAGEDLVFLVGTSFSFVKDVFDKVNNWSTEVNDSTTEVSLEDKTNNSSNKFYFSHPFPLVDEKKQNSKITQDYLYRLDTEDEALKHMDFGLKKPHYFEVDKKNVSLVYAGVDLKINKKLLDLNFQSNHYLEKQIADIHAQNNSNVEWLEQIGDKKIATDFAVLKIKVKVNNIRNPFLSYLKKLYTKEIKIPKILNTHMNLVAGKTDSIFMGGWSKLSDEESEMITMNNLFVKADLKADKQSELQNKKPSELNNKDMFSQYFEHDLYEKNSQFLNSSGSSQKSQNYEIVDHVFHGNDPSGVLVVKFRIQNKQNKIKSREKTVMFSGLKASGNISSKERESVENMRKKKQFDDLDLVQFLEAQPKAISKWKEMKINHSYFYSESLNKIMFENFYFRREKKVNKNFCINNSEYLNISQTLDVPNLNFKDDAKGMIALTKKHGVNEKVMIGMYEGSNEWSNLISGQDRHVGKIMLFTSPFRYDLFNQDNNLSKPSLADSLKKKSLDHKLIHTNRFYISTSNE